MLDQTELKDILSKSEAKLYFVGIGGIAMSAVASIAKSLDYEVTGSDSKEAYSPAKDVLKNAEINFHLGYEAKNIESAKADLYILSAGEGPENPEVAYILENNSPRIGFAELL